MLKQSSQNIFLLFEPTPGQFSWHTSFLIFLAIYKTSVYPIFTDEEPEAQGDLRRDLCNLVYLIQVTLLCSVRQSSDRNMNWSSLTLRSCYIPLIHTPLCCKTLEQHFVHLPSFVCILPHFSLTEHPFLCRQGYHYIPPLTDRKTETLQGDDNLPSHISANGKTGFLVGERGEHVLCHLTNTTSKIMPLQLQTCDSTCPQETLTFFSHGRSKAPP